MIDTKKTIQVWCDLKLDLAGEPVESFYCGFILGYSDLAITLDIVDGYKVWIPWIYIRRIVEKTEENKEVK